MTKFHCVIATPTEQLYAGDVSYVGVPGADGDFGVMAGHAGSVSLLGAGALTIRTDDGAANEMHYIVSGGIAEVIGTALRVLPRYAVLREKVDKADAAQQLEQLRGQFQEMTSEYRTNNPIQVRALEEKIAWFEKQSA